MIFSKNYLHPVVFIPQFEIFNLCKQLSFSRFPLCLRDSDKALIPALPNLLLDKFRSAKAEFLIILASAYKQLTVSSLLDTSSWIKLGLKLTPSSNFSKAYGPKPLPETFKNYKEVLECKSSAKY